MKKQKLIIPIIIALGTPILLYAQEIFALVGRFGLLLSIATPILVGLALLAFFWGIVKFIWGSGENKEQGKNIMIWGVIALFVMISIWGIVRFIQSSLGVDRGSTIPPPYIY